MVNNFQNLHLDDNGFVFDYYTGLTYNSNLTGIFILRELLEGSPLAEISRTLENKYGINRKTASADLDDFLQQLSSLNLLSLEEASSR